MHSDQPEHRGFDPGPEEGPHERKFRWEEVRRGRRGPGGPPPGGRGAFGFRGGHGGGWRGGPGWPPPPPFPGFGFSEPRWRRGPRAKRGDVRAAALALLAEEPRNGYQIIQEIEERSRGMWRPSPGSVYPALQQLEDEGLIRSEDGDGGRKAFHLTDDGRAYVERHADELTAPWDTVAGTVGDDMIDMHQLCAQVTMAATQVLQVGTPAQTESARRILMQARRNLYGILASEDDQAPEDDDGGAATEEG
jgi:DNA-binding PadR family transcriptional regulator